MSPAEILEKLDALHAASKFYGFSIWPAGKGELQISLATTSKTNWRVRRSDTPSEGMGLVLDMDFIDNGVSEPDREPEMLAPPDVDEPPVEDLIAVDEPGIFD